MKHRRRSSAVSLTSGREANVLTLLHMRTEKSRGMVLQVRIVKILRCITVIEVM